jgi:hypothetical protein
VPITRGANDRAHASPSAESGWVLRRYSGSHCLTARCHRRCHRQTIDGRLDWPVSIAMAYSKPGIDCLLCPTYFGEVGAAVQIKAATAAWLVNTVVSPVQSIGSGTAQVLHGCPSHSLQRMAGLGRCGPSMHSDCQKSSSALRVTRPLRPPPAYYCIAFKCRWCRACCTMPGPAARRASKHSHPHRAHGQQPDFKATRWHERAFIPKSSSH